MDFPIYQAEINDGLAEAIKTKTSIAFLAQAKPYTPSKSLMNTLKQMVSKARVANPDQFDLYYMDSILVSVGWNNNDDIFTKADTWLARSTPIDKQINFMHDETDIIGHMVSSIALDINGNIIPDDTDIEKVPDIFDIAVSSVLYKSWSDKDLNERMENIIAEIALGKWFVSMECLFPNFDYGILSPDGQQKVIARSSETAFLTKHLKIYGGKGEYEGNKIGRVLRNFTFSGKGLVDNPANRRSIILPEDSSLFSTKADTTLIDRQKETKDMSDTITKEAFDKLEAQLKDALTKNEQLIKDAQAKAESAFTSEKSKLEDANKSLASKVETQENTIASLKKDVEDRDAKLAEVNRMVAQLTEEKTKAERIYKLTQVGVDAETAAKVVAKWITTTDDQFSDIVELHAKSDKKHHDDDDDDDDDDEVDEKTAASVNLNKAEKDKDATLATAGEQVQELRAAASSWFSSILNTNK